VPGDEGNDFRFEKQSIGNQTMRSSRRGGKRPGAGRRRGSRNKATKEIKARLAKIEEAGGETPLEYLQREMNAPEPMQRAGEGGLAFMARYQAWDRRTMAAAIAAAPFRHPKLASIEHTGKDGSDIQHVHRMEVVFVKSTRHR
jgi:hypothetical protein